MITRRQLLQSCSVAASHVALTSLTARGVEAKDATPVRCRFGLVTYLWGKDLTLPELLTTCETSGALGVELRTTHAHGVEPSLSRTDREDVRKRFEDSPVTLVGIGSNERYDSPKPGVAKQAIEATKDFLQLSHDVGSSGVKVKGDRFYDDVSHEETLAQVVAALQELGEFAKNLGQQVRLEVHGGFREIPVHHEIISRVDHSHVKTCWNSNPADLNGAGLRDNFHKIRPYFGQTAHVRALDSKNYPWRDLLQLFVTTDYDGWVLLEAHGELEKRDVAKKLADQVKLFTSFVNTSS